MKNSHLVGLLIAALSIIVAGLATFFVLFHPDLLTTVLPGSLASTPVPDHSAKGPISISKSLSQPLALVSASKKPNHKLLIIVSVVIVAIVLMAAVGGLLWYFLYYRDTISVELPPRDVETKPVEPVEPVDPTPDTSPATDQNPSSTLDFAAIRDSIVRFFTDTLFPGVASFLLAHPIPSLLTLITIILFFFDKRLAATLLSTMALYGGYLFFNTIMAVIHAIWMSIVFMIILRIVFFFSIRKGEKTSKGVVFLAKVYNSIMEYTVCALIDLVWWGVKEKCCKCGSDEKNDSKHCCLSNILLVKVNN